MQAHSRICLDALGAPPPPLHRTTLPAARRLHTATPMRGYVSGDTGGAMPHEEFAKRTAYILLALTGLIAAGFFQLLQFLQSLPAGRSTGPGSDQPHTAILIVILLLFVFVWLVPLIPLVMVTARVLLRRALRPAPVIAVTLLALLIGFPIAFLAFVAGPVTGPRGSSCGSRSQSAFWCWPMGGWGAPACRSSLWA